MTGFYTTSNEKRYCPICNIELNKRQKIACCKSHSALISGQNPDRNEKIRQAKLGKPRPDMQGDNNPSKRPEVKEKMRTAMKGRSCPWMLGEKNVSKRPEVQEKISAALKGRPAPWAQGDNNYMRNPENAAKWSAHLKSLGENHPSKRPEVREKIRQSRLGKKASDKTRCKMRERLLALGENHWMKRPEHRERIRNRGWTPMEIVMADPIRYTKWKKHQPSHVGIHNSFYGKSHSNTTRIVLSNLAKIRFENPKNHPMWRGGITAERQAFYESDAWKIVAPVVWQRDRATCQKCGRIYNRKTHRFIMDIHHLISFEHKEYRAILWNLILLCRKCHKIVHGKKNITKEFLLDPYK